MYRFNYCVLSAVRNRMKSVKNIQKITKAMKMVAASKLRAVQGRAENSRGLWQPFTALLGDNPSMLRVVYIIQFILVLMMTNSLILLTLLLDIQLLLYVYCSFWICF